MARPPLEPQRPAEREAGTTSVEYGLLVAIVGFVFVATGPALRDALLALLDVILGGMLS